MWLLVIVKHLALPQNILSPSPANAFKWVSLLQWEAGSHHVGESGEVTCVCPASAGDWEGLHVAKMCWGRIWDVRSHMWLPEEKGAKCMWLNLAWPQEPKTSFLLLCWNESQRWWRWFQWHWYFATGRFVWKKGSSQILVTQIWIISLLFKYCSMQLSKRTSYVSVT